MSSVPLATLSPYEKVKAYVALTKPRIIELLLVTTVPTMFMAERGWPELGLVIATLVGGSLAAGGANAFNMVIDRDIDAIMERTKGRPLQYILRKTFDEQGAFIYHHRLMVIRNGFLKFISLAIFRSTSIT